MVVTITSDGNVWTIGRLHDDDNTRVLEECVLRRYDPSGKLLDSRILTAKPGKDLSGRHPAISSSLFSSPDRVGWFTTAGEYIEFSLDGHEIGRYQGPTGLDRPDGVAISEDNDVVLGDFQATRYRQAPPNPRKPQFLILDRSSGE